VESRKALFTKRRLRSGLAALGAVFVVVLAACSGPSGTSGSGTQQETQQQSSGNGTIAVITHGNAGEAFWSVVQNGAEQAGKDLGVHVEYNSDGDPARQARLIDNAVAQKVSGLVVSMANPDALEASIRRAVEAGIPVITINSGASRSTEFGALTHVGQDEAIAGQRAGQRLKDLGKHKLLCVIHEAGNVGLNQRCDGARQGFGSEVIPLQVDINNPTDVESRIKGALQTNPSIDSVLALDSSVAARAASAVQAANSQAQVATFDLNSDVVSAIESGQVVFAVDQQQYLQGYLPVEFLKLYRDNANIVGGGQPVLTGPDLVDKTDAAKIGQYVQRGTR
jgi:simple sugar transport system substrate-binding protein